MEGYSGTPLPRKLGIAAGAPVLVLGDLLGFDLAALGRQAVREPEPGTSFDVVLLFSPGQQTLAGQWPAAAAACSPTGALWVCWPKKSARVPTDLSDDAVRTFGLAAGLVDVKVAAIDATWSGLKFVVRLRDR